VHVYFASDATKAQENAVGARLSHDSRVKQVVFVSKEQALVKMKHDFKDLFRTPLPSNPLPDSYTVVPKKAAFTPVIGKEVRQSSWAGVDKVSWGSATAKRVLTIAKVISLVF